MNTLSKFFTLSAASAALVFTGCQAPGPTTTAQRAQVTNQVGSYPPPPAGIQRVRVGVPPFQVDTRQGAVEGMNVVAADQATTLLMNTGRFGVIERAQLEQLLREQELEGIVRWDEMAQMGEVRGVDYLMIGRVTSFRVQASQSGSNFGVGRQQLPFGGALGAFDFRNRSSRIDVECGIDLRLVDPSTGEIVAAQFSEYTRTDSISGFNVQVLGVSTGAEANLQLQEGDEGRILRLAIDDAIYKMLPQIDNYLLTRVSAE
jgi:curli biogenesis system outer membrane secretion channel CsgG